ncbi:MAG TPA: tol-pal system protein YbgF [Rhizobiaceae bacterium]|nr:tol-pal system protein YbgF [Rhizobiaceae bacterium]
MRFTIKRLAVGGTAAALCLGLSAVTAAAWELRLPLSGDQTGRNYVLAQAADATSRAMQLEEEVRALTGKVEDLTFQLLQLQETLRKMQEDNEFRFQELESGKQGAVAPADGSDAAAPRIAMEDAAPGKLQPSEQDAGAQRSDGDEIAGLIEAEPSAPGKPPRMIDGVEVYEGPSGPAPALEPRILGTLRFDENGNVIEAAPGEPIDLSNPPPSAPVGEVPVEAGDLPPPAGVGEAQLPGVETGAAAPGESGGQVASLAMSDNPAQLYELGYGYVQAGDYEQAEAAFRQFTTRHQDNARMGEASFWLGESVFAQRRYEEAAKIFLDAHKKYPDNVLGAQNLLKLGVSLAGMNQRELACATFAEVPNKYPKLSNAVRAKLQAEQKAISCTTN